MTVADDGAYSEIMLIGVTPKGSTEVQFAGYIDLDGIDPKQGDKDGSAVPLANGGRIWKKTPQGESEVTVKLYEIDISKTSSLAQHFHGNSDASAPLQSTNTHTRNLFRVAFLWTDDSAAATAGGSTTAGNYSRRIVFLDMRMTSYQAKIEDGVLVFNVTFKGPPFDKASVGKYVDESVASTDSVGLSALASYS